jgi:hypothetical protein
MGRKTKFRQWLGLLLILAVLVGALLIDQDTVPLRTILILVGVVAAIQLFWLVFTLARGKSSRWQIRTNFLWLLMSLEVIAFGVFMPMNPMDLPRQITWVVIFLCVEGFTIVMLGYCSLQLFLEYRERKRRMRESLCIKCGYDLRASPHRCPECGMVPTKLVSTPQ